MTGTSGSLTHQVAVTLVVQAPQPDFGITALPAGQTIFRGGSATYTVTISRTNGFSAQVSLSASGLPNRSSYLFTPNPGTGSSTLNISTSRPSHYGTYMLTITGTGGGQTHSTTVTLTLQ